MMLSINSDVRICTLLSAFVFLTCFVVLSSAPTPTKRCESGSAAASSPGFSLDMNSGDLEKSDPVRL